MRGENGRTVQRTLEGISSCSDEDSDRTRRIILRGPYDSLRVQLVVGEDECTLWDLEFSGEGGWRVEG
jgi:hypothetical protein